MKWAHKRLVSRASTLHPSREQWELGTYCAEAGAQASTRFVCVTPQHMGSQLCRYHLGYHAVDSPHRSNGTHSSWSPQTAPGTYAAGSVGKRVEGSGHLSAPP